jgi:hypothetical protein
MRFILAATAWSLALTGCASSGGRDGKSANEAAKITYSLARTEAKVSVENWLIKCSANGLLISPKVSIVHAAMPDTANEFTLTGAGLTSFFKEKSLEVTLYDHGAIKSINTTATDKTGTIIGNIVKLLPMLGAGGPPDSAPADRQPCNADTQRALALRDAYVTKIAELRDSLTQKPVDPAAVVKAINAYAEQAAQITTTKLIVSWSAPIDLSVPFSTAPKYVAPTEATFARWTDAKTNKSIYALALKIVASATGTPPAPLQCPTDDPNCANTIVFREPVAVPIEVSTGEATGTDSAYVLDDGRPLDQGHVLAAQQIPVAQWGAKSMFKVNVGFGGSKTFAANLDAYGRRTSFTWKSNARGEGLTSAIGGIVKEVDTVQKSLADPTEMQVMQAKTAELKARQEYNKYLACEAILRAGGFDCPTK